MMFWKMVNAVPVTGCRSASRATEDKALAKTVRRKSDTFVEVGNKFSRDMIKSKVCSREP